MYHYIKSEPTLWTVGTGSVHDRTFVPESDHASADAAAARVAYLNGGAGGVDLSEVLNKVAGLERRLNTLGDTAERHGDAIEALSASVASLGTSRAVNATASGGSIAAGVVHGTVNMPGIRIDETF